MDDGCREHAHVRDRREPQAVVLGPDGNGELGTNDTSTRFEPAIVDTTATWSAVDLGKGTSCGVVESPLELRCWGDNSEGQLGNGTTSQAPVVVPAAVGNVTAPADVTLGTAHACVRDGTTAKCWGRNSRGQLGLGDAATHIVPTTLRSTWDQLALGGEHSCGIQQETLWCWGSNRYGQTGSADLVTATQTQRVTDEPGWAHVAAGATHSCAIKSDATLWCWGSNERGQLGLGTAWSAELTQVH